MEDHSRITALQAVAERQSIRQFLPDAVPEADIVEILRIASRAPSGQNMQPWRVHVVTGESRDVLCREVSADVAAGKGSEEYPYFAPLIREPFLSRRRKVGFDLHAIYGVDRGDMEGRLRALLRNFDFFGAPVGLFFTIDRDSGYGAWIDCAMLMMNVMTVAPAFGLQTCPQQAWCEFSAPVRRVLAVPDDQVIVSGMALGHADWDAPVNALVTERTPPEQFVVRHR